MKGIIERKMKSFYHCFFLAPIIFVISTSTTELRQNLNELERQKSFLAKKDQAWTKANEDVAFLLRKFYDISDDIEVDKITNSKSNSNRDDAAKFIDNCRDLLTADYIKLKPSNYKKNPWASKYDLINQALDTIHAFIKHKAHWKTVFGQVTTAQKWMNGFGIKV